MSEAKETTETADAERRVEVLVSCGYCMNCKHFKPIEWERMGDCTNTVNFFIGYGRPRDAQISISGAVIEGDEGWGWHVGRNFGCVHFESVTANARVSGAGHDT